MLILLKQAFGTASQVKIVETRAVQTNIDAR